MNHPRKSHTSILGFSRLIRAILPLIIIVVASVSAVLGAEAQPTKRVLMLFSESKFVLGNVLVEQAARDVLRQAARSIEFYAEYLDAGRFPEETHYRLFREYLQEKYAQRSPDLVMAFLARKFELAGQLPAELFPNPGSLRSLAFPAEYGNSGVMTFIVNHDGKVFQKDLRKSTASVAQR